MQIQRTLLDKYMDFYYGYLILKSYIFKLRLVEEYPNRDYLNKWREFLSAIDYSALIEDACNYIKEEVDGRILDIADTMERASYYALIHPEHPNITLGFIKDADLWNLWLEYGIYKYARESIVDFAGIGSGDRVLDLGCGSASPPFYAEVVGSTGFYAGVDHSRPLINIAEKNCRELQVSDWVRLMHGYADSKLEFKRHYDFVILSSVLEYVDVNGALKNAVSALNGEGRIVVFSELFRDVEPDRADLFHLYYSLIPGFRSFPAVNEIKVTLDRMGVVYSMKYYGRHVVVIDILGGPGSS